MAGFKFAYQRVDRWGKLPVRCSIASTREAHGHATRRRIRIVAAFVWVVALAVACSNNTPSKIIVPAPSPTSGKLFRVSSALLSPADLTFNETYPVTSWQRCDDYSVEKSLQGYRASYRVSGSAAAIWEYGGCSSADQKARLDEYAWLLQSDNAAAELSDALSAASFFGNVTPPPGHQVRQFEHNSVVVRTLSLESSGGKLLYAAEIVGQAGTAVTFMRITTATELTDENYLVMAQLCLDRLRAVEGAK